MLVRSSAGDSEASMPAKARRKEYTPNSERIPKKEAMEHIVIDSRTVNAWSIEMVAWPI